MIPSHLTFTRKSNLTEFSNQRLLYKSLKSSDNLAGDFLCLDKFIRQFPRLALESNEYLVSIVDGEHVAVRRMTGFIDQFPDEIKCMDISCRQVSEESADWDELKSFLEKKASGFSNFSTFYVLSAENDQAGQLLTKVDRREVELK